MRTDLALAIALSFLLLSGCITIPQEAAKPLSQAKELVKKSSIPIPSGSPQQATVPSAAQQANATSQTAANQSPPASLQQAGQTLSVSNNTTTAVSAPSSESAEVLQTEISISNPQQPQVYFYYSSYCPYSIRILPYMQLEQTRFENFTEWHSFNVFTRQGYYFFDKMAQERNLSARVVPVVIVAWGKNSRMMTGIQEINSTMVSLIWNITKDARLAAN